MGGFAGQPWLEGNLIEVVTRALLEGPDALDVGGLEVGTPVQPMLAKTATSVTDAMTDLGSVLVERKLDGLRVQVHKNGQKVCVFSRNLRDITAEMPEVVESARHLDVSEVILDGEGLLVTEEGTPMPFQDSMSIRDGTTGQFRAFYFDCASPQR